MDIWGSVGDAFNHNFEQIPISTEVRRCIFQVLDCISVDKCVILNPSIVVDIVFFEKVDFRISNNAMKFSLVITISVSVYFEAILIGMDVLPLALEVLEYFHWSGFAASHFTTKFIKIYEQKLYSYTF